MNFSFQVVARSVAGLRVPAAEEDADRAVGRLESPRRRGTAPTGCVPRPRGSRPCSSGNCRACPCRCRRAPSRPAGSGSTGRRRGRCVALAWLYGPSAPMPEFMPISLRIGPLTTRNRRKGRRAARARGDAARGHRQDHRQVLGPRAGHDGIDRDLLDVELPELAERRRAQPADDLVARDASCP